MKKSRRPGMVVVIGKTTGLPAGQALRATIIRPDGTLIEIEAHP